MTNITGYTKAGADAKFAPLASPAFSGSATVAQGYLVLDWSGTDAAHAPEIHSLGFNGWWGGPAIDVANSPTSRDMVTLYKGNDYWINDAGLTSGSPTLTSATEGAFSSLVVGAGLVGAGIPNGTTVLSVESATSLTMSGNATATATGVRVHVNRAGVTDLIYTRHGGGKSATVGIRATPPSGTHGLEVGSSANDLTLGNLKLKTGVGQTGTALTVTDSGGVDRLWVTGTNGAPLLSGNHSSYGEGVAMTRAILAPDVTNITPLIIKHPSGATADLALFQLANVSKMGFDSTGRLKWYDAALNTTGAGSAALGANCPATTATAPYTWLSMKTADGSTAFIPCWK